MNVFEVPLMYKDLLEAVENGELSEEQMADTIESLKGEIEAVLEGSANAHKNYMAHAEMLKAESKKLKEKADKKLKAAERTLEFMDAIMKAANLKTVEAGVHTLKYHKGLEVVEVNEEEVPEYELFSDLYEIQPPKLIGKTELKKRLKEGAKIPGVSLVRRPDSLKIK